MEIPLSLTVHRRNHRVGLALSALFAWPYPEQTPAVAQRGIMGLPLPSVSGVYAWPVWYPLPEWLPVGSWQLGLATGLAGALAGLVMLREECSFLFGLGRGHRRAWASATPTS